MNDPRPTRGLNPRVREAVGARRPAQRDNGEPIRMGDVSPETVKRIAELLRQHRPKWPPNCER